MADTEEPQFNTLAERIAALNKQKNFTTVPSPNLASGPVRKRPPPPPPPARPAIENRSYTVPIISTSHSPVQSTPAIPPRPKRNGSTPTQHESFATKQEPPRNAPPPLPSRTSSTQPSPSLPPRRTSTQPPGLMVRRGSGSSEISQHSTLSTLSIGRAPSSVTSNGSDGTLYKLPPSFDPTNLPKLPPTRREREAQAQEASRPKRVVRSPHPVRQTESTPPPQPVRKAESVPPPQPVRKIQALPAPKPSLPPRLPARPVKSNPTTVCATPEPQEEIQPRKVPPRPSAVKRAPILGFNLKPTQPKEPEAQELPPVPSPQPQVSNHDTSDDGPPPVPASSRPSFAQIEAVATRTIPAVTEPILDCLVCRDWTSPDAVAAQYPRESLPRNDPIGYLAQNLCGPFPSYTDKARAIFTWFHHNIDYDVGAFFGNNVKYMSAEDTIFTGRAVCAGYAETYKAIANRAGLDCVVVGGHGKGFGYVPLKKGERAPPPDPTGHAWNAVRIDGGHWKLLDACWGAGHVSGQQYTAKFSPIQFIDSNENFGRRHFPSNSQHQFRQGGESITWEDYYVGGMDGEPPMICGDANTEGIAESSIEPNQKHIAAVDGEVVRFQFSQVCEHWTSEKNGLGKAPLLLLSLPRGEGQRPEMVPLETNGYWHWADVRAEDLGPRGNKVSLVMITKFGDREARGLGADEFRAKFGRVATGWSILVSWELV